jgi:hypothetical protein
MPFMTRMHPGYPARNTSLFCHLPHRRRDLVLLWVMIRVGVTKGSIKSQWRSPQYSTRMKVRICLLLRHQMINPILLVLHAEWMLKHDLPNKRVWVTVRNSRPDPFTGDSGFGRGLYDGDRGVIMSATSAAAVEVSLSRKGQTITIPSGFLFPWRPTGKKQAVVIIHGEHAGYEFVTHSPTSPGLFPLYIRGKGKGRGNPICVVEVERLARCDPL